MRIDQMRIENFIGFFKIVGLLINRGAKTEIPNNQGYMPIHLAARNGTTNAIVEIYASVY